MMIESIQHKNKQQYSNSNKNEKYSEYLINKISKNIIYNYAKKGHNIIS